MEHPADLLEELADDPRRALAQLLLEPFPPGTVPDLGSLRASVRAVRGLRAAVFAAMRSVHVHADADEAAASGWFGRRWQHERDLARAIAAWARAVAGLADALEAIERWLQLQLARDQGQSAHGRIGGPPLTDPNRFALSPLPWCAAQPRSRPSWPRPRPPLRLHGRPSSPSWTSWIAPSRYTRRPS